jgi:hypothetical protein
VDEHARLIVIVIVPAWKSMFFLAASVGCADVLEELVDNRQCELTADAHEAAAAEGHQDALCWLHSRGCPCDRSVCEQAACGGRHLEMLQYSHEHGCHWNSYACSDAAREGS